MKFKKNINHEGQMACHLAGAQVHKGPDSPVLSFLRDPVRRLNGQPFSLGGKFLNMRLTLATC
jgi:hypothetical protein